MVGMISIPLTRFVKSEVFASELALLCLCYEIEERGEKSRFGLIPIPGFGMN